MTKKQQAKIAKYAKCTYEALQDVANDLGSWAECDTPEKRDEWIAIVAMQGMCQRWFDETYARETMKP